MEANLTPMRPQLDGLMGLVDPVEPSELGEAKQLSDPTIDPTSQALAPIREAVDSSNKMRPPVTIDLAGGPNTARGHEDHAHLPKGKAPVSPRRRECERHCLLQAKLIV